MNILYDEINEILTEWNPIGVDSRIAKDEYKSYIPKILKNIDNKEKLINFLKDMLINNLGAGFDPMNIDHTLDLQKVCDRLFQLYLDKRKE